MHNLITTISNAPAFLFQCRELPHSVFFPPKVITEKKAGKPYSFCDCDAFIPPSDLNEHQRMIDVSSVPAYATRCCQCSVRPVLFLYTFPKPRAHLPEDP